MNTSYISIFTINGIFIISRIRIDTNLNKMNTSYISIFTNTPAIHIYFDKIKRNIVLFQNNQSSRMFSDNVQRRNLM